MNNAKSSSNMINSSDEKENEEIEILTKKLNDAQRIVKTTEKKKSYFSAKADVDEDID